MEHKVIKAFFKLSNKTNYKVGDQIELTDLEAKEMAKNGLIEYEVTPNHNMYASEAKSLTHKKLNLGLIQSEKIWLILISH